MAGCCIVVLSIIMIPVLVVAAAGLIAIKFVTSPAFIFLLASGACCLFALIDAVLILWRHFKTAKDEKLGFASFKRPLILLLAATALFIIMAVLAGSMLMEWYAEIEAMQPA